MLGSVQGLSILLNVVRTKLVAMLIGPEGVGLNDIYNRVRELIHTTTNVGLDTSGVRGISMSYEKLHQARTDEEKTSAASELEQQITLLRSWELLFACLGVLVCLCLAGPVSYFTFKDYDHLWDYALLAPTVGFSTIICGELVMLKSIRRLKVVALVSMLHVMAGIFVTVPIYYIFGLQGIISAILAFTAVQTVIVISFSYKYYKPRFNMRFVELVKGMPMIRLGMSFVVAGIMAQGAELLISSYFNGSVSASVAGLYRAGYTMTATYAGLVFSAFDTEYFPRLSGVVNDVRLRCQTVCQQLEVGLILMCPVLVSVAVALPILIPLLYSDKFADVIPMTQIAVISIFFRTIYLPSAYLPLASGHSRTYMFIQFVGACDLLLVIVGYSMLGLVGAGLGLVAGNLIDLCLVSLYAYFKYSIRYTVRIFKMILIYALLIIITYFVTTICDGVAYWLLGMSMMIICCSYSLFMFKRINKHPKL